MIAILLLPMSSSGQAPSYVSTRDAHPEFAFDFWLGVWDVNLRVFQDDGSWADEKSAVAKIYPILEGRAVLELWDESMSGVDAIRGFSIRYFDNDADEWVLFLNWPGRNRSGIGSLAGKFRHGRGEFFSERAIDDTTTLISRYTFSDITKNSLRWDDAFSRDGGKTWSNNWIMEFTRSGSTAEWPGPGENAHTYYDGARCDREEFGVVHDLAGEWKGSVTVGDHTETGPFRTYAILDGCATLTFLRGSTGKEPFEEFGFLSYNTYANMYEYATLSTEPGSRFESRYGSAGEDGTIVFESKASSRTKRRYTLKPAGDRLSIVREDGTSAGPDAGIEWIERYRGRFSR
ncbi:MAG: hypothetical protein HKN20_16905 [Gemmatimonadetes bacterium]|nr:hypothetical protein [Gemmatimonadota bacterium]